MKPRSIELASSPATHIPSRSPCFAWLTGFRNICMDLIFFSWRKAGISTTSFTASPPDSTVPSALCLAFDGKAVIHGKEEITRFISVGHQNLGLQDGDQIIHADRIWLGRGFPIGAVVRRCQRHLSRRPPGLRHRHLRPRAFHHPQPRQQAPWNTVQIW